MKTSKIIAIAIFLMEMSVAANGRAAEAPAANPYSGDIWSRSTLSGDWWAFRNKLAEKGVTIDSLPTIVRRKSVGTATILGLRAQMVV